MDKRKEAETALLDLVLYHAEHAETAEEVEALATVCSAFLDLVDSIFPEYDYVFYETVAEAITRFARKAKTIEDFIALKKLTYTVKCLI